MEIHDSSKLKPKVVLGVGAHADDLDFGSSGSIAKLVQEGADAYYLIITDGSKGSDDYHTSSADLIKLRREEQRAAGKKLGLKDVIFLEYEDGMLEISLQLKKDIVRVIRQLKPEAVFCFDPSMLYDENRGFINHPDHRAAGQATLDAVFPLARDHLSFPDLYADGLEPHKVKTVLMTNFVKQNYMFDVSDMLDTKFAALAEHKSQVPDIASVRQYFTQMAAKLGEPYGVKHAEGFLRLDLPQ
jgi:LmbE family N-acetylglucosaminyl deacetylase